MPTPKQTGPQQLPSSNYRKKPTTTTPKLAHNARDDPDISDDESYFSSKHEPEYLTRLTLAVANGDKCRNRMRPFRHHIRAVKHNEYTNDGPTSPAPTVSTFSLETGETGFRYLVSDDFDAGQEARTNSPKDGPSAQFTRRQRSNSEASDALPQMQSFQSSAPSTRREVDYDDLDSDSDGDDSDSCKSLEASFLHPRYQQRAQYDGQRCASPSQRLRGFALRPSKRTVNISSPALANRLGVPLSAELEVWIDELKKK